MSAYTKLFEERGIRENARECSDIMARVELTSFSEEQLSDIGRLQKVTAILASKINSLDPDLLTADSINHLHSGFANAVSHIRAFEKSPDISQVNAANNHLDNVLNQLRTFAFPTDEKDLSEGLKASAATHSALRNMVAKSEKMLESGQAALSELDTKIRGNEAKISEADASIAQQKERLDKAITEFQQQFSQGEAKRSTTNTDLLEELRGRFEDSEEARSKEFDDHLSSTKKDSAEFKRYLDSRKGEVDTIFGVIGDNARAGQFSRTANQERDSANLFRWISLVFMALMIAAAIFTYIYSLTHPGVEWPTLLLRFGTTLILAIPAVYAAQESSKHRDREKRLRKTHLELASIDAYLALLPKEKQQEIKAEFTAKFFGNSESLVEVRDEISKNALWDLLKQVVKQTTKS